MPSPERLYTQKECVDEGTVENTVSIFTVSIENVNIFDGEVVKESSSEQAASIKQSEQHNIANISFIVKYNAF